MEISFRLGIQPVVITCPDCKKEISESAKQCPQCGWRRPSNIPWPIIIIGLLFAAVFFLASEFLLHARTTLD
jgi:hypothetical protein